MTIKIGVIAEGKTDHVVYSKFIGKHFKDRKVEMLFIKEQPGGDATSSSPGGGWLEVKRWCLTNQPRFRSGRLQKGLFKDPSNNSKPDLFLIHMDSDVAEKIRLEAHEATVDLSTPNRRGAYIRQKLREWLWPDENAPDLTGHVISPAVDATEAWIICALNNDKEIETREDLARLLVTEISRKNIYKIDPRAKKPSKREDNYTKICDHALDGVSNVYKHCAYFKRACDDIEAQIVPVKLTS